MIFHHLENTDIFTNTSDKKTPKAMYTSLQGALNSKGDVEASLSYRARDVACSVPAVPFQTQK